MNLTPFESEILDSILHQVEGLARSRVTRRATTRILRATLRRIKARRIGRSRASNPTDREVDHAVPVAVVCDRILETPGLDRAKLKQILADLLVAVELTSNEHGLELRSCGLSDCMPADWNGVDVLARYRVAGIEVVQFESSSQPKHLAEETTPKALTSQSEQIGNNLEGAALAREVTTELPYPMHSEFFAPVEVALDAKKSSLDTPLSIFLKPSGYRRDVEIMIDPGNSRTFFANWKSTDSSRFSSRLRAAAAVLRQRGFAGRFRLTHDNGHVTIERL